MHERVGSKAIILGQSNRLIESTPSFSTARLSAVAVGTPITVQQKLMRHADIRTAMNIYGDVVTDEMTQAHSKVVRLAIPRAN